MFEYMAAGIPVVASAFPLWKSIVEKSGCGVCVDPQDVNAVAGAIKYLLAHEAEAEAMGARGREAVMNEYNWKNESGKLVELYKRISGK
jgi:glycosyltransferase involved in cell wall biosynthesis